MDTSPQVFLCGVELECQSFAEDGPAGRPDPRTLGALVSTHSCAAPALQGRTGFFNAYGRVYLDWGHYELASAECASPYDVPGVLERQEQLLAEALAAERRAGRRLRLANNNHSGLLEPDAATWGAHESYLVERDPQGFGPAILPFLCTRVYAGAGGVLAQDGSYVSGVRCCFMERDEGGLTTGARAIHSTCRNEPLADPARRGHRYHLLLGDGQRSQFALALKLGATLLALRAVFHTPDLLDRVRGVGYRVQPGAVGHRDALRVLNVLAQRGRPPRAHPLCIAVQRVYLGAAERWAAGCPDAPPWVERCLMDWRRTLDALEQDDLDWLRSHLDAFAKHALMDAVLAGEGVPWEGLGARRGVLALLTLLDHDYHELGRPDGLLRRLELSGLFTHRVAPPLDAGAEAEPFVPGLGTRADARARRIRESPHDPGLVCDWSWIARPTTRAVSRLGDPFAVQPGPFEVLSPGAFEHFRKQGSLPSAEGESPGSPPRPARTRTPDPPPRGRELPF